MEWRRRTRLMGSWPRFLSLAGSYAQEWGVTLAPGPLDGWAGSCMTIPCSFTYPAGSLTWYLNPVYVFEKKDFSGTVLYKHNVAISPAFAGRVRFLGDLERDCSLQLSDLRASENGSYGLRLVVSNPRKQEEEKKWMTQISVNVTGKRESPGIPCRNRLKIYSPAQPSPPPWTVSRCVWAAPCTTGPRSHLGQGLYHNIPNAVGREPVT
uniref:B-cell receptor CD22 first Ig-like domain-containing protein n=1 Tax=Gopherus evgoodei TaxID=1825980 RepID=A0A8C4WN16_9SAUR